MKRGRLQARRSVRCRDLVVRLVEVERLAAGLRRA